MEKAIKVMAKTKKMGNEKEKKKGFFILVGI